MKNIWKLVAVAVAVALSNQQLSAEIIVSVDQVTVEAGMNVLVEVNATGDESLTSFDVPFDIGNDGFPDIAPTGLSLVGVTSGEPFGNMTFFGSAENLQEDLIVNDLSLGGGVALTSNPTLLFTMEFEVGGSVPGGTVFDLTIIRDDKFVVNGVNNPGSGTDPQVTVNNGSITVTAVPEPSSLALFGFLGLAGIASGRRRQTLG